MLLEKLRDLRRSIDGGVERLRDRERADLCDCLSNWLVHALSEQTQTKAELSIRGFSLYADVLSSLSGGPTCTAVGEPAPLDGSIWQATAHGEYQLGDCLAKRSTKRWFIGTDSLGKNSSRVAAHNTGASATIRTGTNFRENVGRLHPAHRALKVILALAGIEVLNG